MYVHSILLKIALYTAYTSSLHFLFYDKQLMFIYIEVIFYKFHNHNDNLSEIHLDEVELQG